MFLQKEASYLYVAIVAPSGIIFPLLAAIIKYKKLNKELKVICWYIFLAAFANLVCNSLGFNGINNMPVMHIYTPIEFTLLITFYQLLLREEMSGRVLKMLIPAFLIFCIVNALFLQGIYTYNTNTKSIEALVIISLTLAYFKKKLDKMQFDEGEKYLIYINSGLLLYFAGSFVLFFIPSIIVPDRPLERLIWSTHATFLLVMYLLFAVALWKYKK
ncbi:MAG: hypothetical protein K9G49_10190 [Taibaiella sp.]|nr:hypothetical protein [Taibaiella sp.]